MTTDLPLEVTEEAGGGEGVEVAAVRAMDAFERESGGSEVFDVVVGDGRDADFEGPVILAIPGTVGREADACGATQARDEQGEQCDDEVKGATGGWHEGWSGDVGDERQTTKDLSVWQAISCEVQGGSRLLAMVSCEVEDERDDSA